MTVLSRRGFLGGVGAVGVGAALAACGGNGGGSAGSNHLDIWIFDSRQPADIEKRFTKDNPHITVNVTTLASADLEQRLLVALQAGTGLPDVVQLLVRHSAQMFATQQFLDLSDILRPLAKDFPDGYLIGTGSEINAFTMGPGNMGLWLNHAALGKHGIDTADLATWDDVVTASRTLKKSSGGKQFMLIQPTGENLFDYYNAFFHSRGGDWWNVDSKLVADKTLAVDTLQFLLDRKNDGAVYAGDWSQPSFWQSCKNDQVLGFGMNYSIGGVSLPANVPSQSGQWRLVTWPRWSATAPQRTGNFGGSLYAGLKSSANPDAVRTFIKWWLTDDGLHAQQDTMGLVPYKPAAKVLDMNRGVAYFGGQPIAKDLDAVPYPPFHYENWAKTQDTVQYAVEQTLLGKSTPRAAIGDALSQMAKF
jgi:ABC-type glycerol-3-phosphate transport system substrate-binding protein